MPLLLLVGAGHAHLHLVKHAEELSAAGYRVHLLAPRFFDYSGVASATAAGHLHRDAGRIDVRPLADAHGVELHEDTLAAVDVPARVATTSRGARQSYDVLSLNVGSVVAQTDMSVHPAVLTVKPLSGLADLAERLRVGGPTRSGRATGMSGAIVTVVGGGASGVELAAHLAVRPDVAEVRLVESGPAVGLDLPTGARRRVTRLLESRHVSLVTGQRVRAVEEHRLVLVDGTELPHDVALLSTGLVAPRLVTDLGLGDEHGVPVRATLQHVDHEDIYAAGDCAHFLPAPLPRIGVHGVRQGPVLLESLLARRRGGPLPEYSPQRRALSILDLGDDVGLAVRGRWWCYGRLPLRLKRSIDDRWLQTYREGASPSG